MPRVLLLATTTGYQVRAFGEAAERLGVELVFATDRCDHLEDPWQDGAIPIRFHDEDTSVAAIVEAARARPIHGVLVVGDRPTVIGARVAQAIGLPWHSAEAAVVASDKQRTRECLRNAGLPVPSFVPMTMNDTPSALSHQPWRYPCVLKPVSLSGSRGVMRADDEASFSRSFERLRALLLSPDVRAERNEAHDRILVEGFIPGREYAIEGLMHDGTLNCLAVFDKPDPLDGPFFEETIYVTPSVADAAVQRAIVDAVTAAAQAIGLSHGPIHAECRVNQHVYVLEVAARPIGGLCARALRFRADQDAAQASLEEVLLRSALGEHPGRWHREDVASGVMMIPIPRAGILRGVDGVESAEAEAHVGEVRITAKIEQKLVPLPEGASYLGFIFARAGTPGEVERALRAAHGRLTFRIDRELPVQRGSQIHYNQGHG
jgi:biotin carboxylase